MHVRRQIRDSIITLLTNSTNAGANVYSMRVHPVSKDNVPAIIIYTVEETAENQTIGDISSLRDLTLAIEIYVKQFSLGASGPEKEIDLICEQVENLIGATNDVQGEAKAIEYQGVEIDLNGEADNAFLVAKMQYSIIYSVMADDVGVLV